MLRLLLDAKADLNDRTYGPPALAFASQQCQVPAVRFLLDEGARADLGPEDEKKPSEKECRHNPLYYLLKHRGPHCISKAPQEITKLLLDKNAAKGMPAHCAGRSCSFFGGMSSCVYSLITIIPALPFLMRRQGGLYGDGGNFRPCGPGDGAD